MGAFIRRERTANNADLANRRRELLDRRSLLNIILRHARFMSFNGHKNRGNCLLFINFHACTNPEYMCSCRNWMNAPRLTLMVIIVLEFEMHHGEVTGRPERISRSSFRMNARSFAAHGREDDERRVASLRTIELGERRKSLFFPSSHI